LASAERHAVLDAWKQELARIEAKRAKELAEEAERQAAVERKRLVDLHRPVATFARGESESWPSLDYDAFLADDGDLERRQELWLLFRPAEREARAFATSRERWLPIRGVSLGAHGHLLGKWSTNRFIQLQTDSDASVRFHEVFHPVFHASELNAGKGDRDGAWNEAFCDAFA